LRRSLEMDVNPAVLLEAMRLLEPRGIGRWNVTRLSPGFTSG